MSARRSNEPTTLAATRAFRFIYDIDSGKLFYDTDGTGAGEAVLLVRLSGAPAIDAVDFIIV
jgi:hypothetical protein